MKSTKLKQLLASVVAMTLLATGITGCTKGTEDGNAVGDTNVEVYQAALPTEVQDSEIYVAPINGIDENFIRGMDISSLLVEEASGVKYFDEAGQEQDLFKILADNGVNYIRVRVWNNPYDEAGNGYGGGNCDASTAATLGSRAAAYGMKLNVDFHYSDFWADPSKQMCPKAWADMNIDEKQQAIYDYTVESLNMISDAGADIGMVQIGNEINHGMAGETTEDNIILLLKKASEAVRKISAERGNDIKIAVHFTNVDDKSSMLRKALWLSNEELDYDIFGISYYSYWHGGLKNMKDTLATIKGQYKKDVMVLETSFPYTGEDGDCFGNSVSEDDIVGEYICSAQSQANAVWDVMSKMAEIGGLGVFYWEGAWIPVGNSYDTNQEIWNKFGSGWASSYSTDYDPNDAGKYYGGCSWDNQAFFDFDGKVLPSLGVFKYIYCGTNTPEKLEFFKSCSVEVTQGQDIVMPEGVYGVYNNRELSREVPTVWKAEELEAIDTSMGGEYQVHGITEDGYEVIANILVTYANLLDDQGFENGSAAWQVGFDCAVNPTDIQNKASDAYAGEKAMHFWNADEEQVFWVEQTITATEDGTYNAFAYIQGGDAGSDHEVRFYIKVNGEEAASDDTAKLTGWKQWSRPEVNGVEAAAGDEITVGMYVSCAAGGWGTMDEFCLYKD